MAHDDTKSTSDTADDLPADDGSGVGETSTSATGVVGSVISPSESSVQRDAARAPGTAQRRADIS